MLRFLSVLWLTENLPSTSKRHTWLRTGSQRGQARRGHFKYVTPGCNKGEYRLERGEIVWTLTLFTLKHRTNSCINGDQQRIRGRADGLRPGQGGWRRFSWSSWEVCLEHFSLHRRPSTATPSSASFCKTIIFLIQKPEITRCIYNYQNSLNCMLRSMNIIVCKLYLSFERTGTKTKTKAKSVAWIIYVG